MELLIVHEAAGGMAARGAGAAVGDTGGRGGPLPLDGRLLREPPACIPPGPERRGLFAPPLKLDLQHVGSSFNLASSPADLLCAVTDRPEHLIALRGWWAAKEGLAKKRVHVFPDDLSFFGNFEETTEGGLSDQCVAVRQALSVAHARREEIPSRLVLVLPYNLVCGWIDLDHPRIRHRVIETVRPVIEYQDIAVLQQRWRMLASDRGRAKFPDDFSGLAGDANNRGGRPVAGQDIAVRQLVDTVALGPKRARRLHLGDAVRRWVEMLPRAPLPNGLPCRSNLGQVIGVHLTSLSR